LRHNNRPLTFRWVCTHPERVGPAMAKQNDLGGPDEPGPGAGLMTPAEVLRVTQPDTDGA